MKNKSYKIINIRHIMGKNLIKAVHENKIDEVLNLVSAEAPINLLDETGRNVIALSVFKENIFLLSLFCKLCPKTMINDVDFFGNTALHNAVMNKNLLYANYLISIGARKDLKNLKGETAIDIALKLGIDINKSISFSCLKEDLDIIPENEKTKYFFKNNSPYSPEFINSIKKK
jgi:ankyrin repeat protein